MTGAGRAAARRFRSDGVEIAFLDEGEGEPVLLVHGFASNAAVNWVNPGWVAALTRAGRRAVAFDNRGHGLSDKPHDIAAYGGGAMADDARRLLDHLGLSRVDALGYSLGARISADLALRAPERVRSLVLAGIGRNLVEGQSKRDEIAAALEAASLAEVAGETGRAFRDFAERTGSDRAALAACIRAPRPPPSAAALARLAMPVLVAAGSRDVMAGSPDELARLIPGAAVLTIPNRDHMNAVGDRVFKEGVLAFLARRP